MKQEPCVKCGAMCYRSGLGTCPKCVSDWVMEYKKMHDKRYGKRNK
jgi:hypothetical protein